MKEDTILDAAATVLADSRPTARMYLTQHYDEVAQMFAAAMAAGRTKREFWDTLAAELARASIVGQQGRMNAMVLDKAWMRVVAKRRKTSACATASVAAPRPAAPKTDEPRPRFTPISGKKN